MKKCIFHRDHSVLTLTANAISSANVHSNAKVEQHHFINMKKCIFHRDHSVLEILTANAISTATVYSNAKVEQHHFIKKCLQLYFTGIIVS